MRGEMSMAKKNDEDGVDLPPELKRAKEQIESERLEHVKTTCKSRFIQSVHSHHAPNHRALASTRSDEEKNNARYNNVFPPPLFHYNGFFYENDGNTSEEFDIPNDEEEVTLPSVKLPFIEKLPQSVSWVFTDSNKLMVESESVFGKKQTYYEDGEAVLLDSDDEKDDEHEKDDEQDDDDDEEEEEETEKKIYEFSEGVDQFIWKIGQEHSLDDPVVQSALSKYLKVDASDILERYNELIEKQKTSGKIEEVSCESEVISFWNSADGTFCRRCLIFHCQMHDEDQPVINTRENKSILFEDEDFKKPCSEHCYLKEKGENVVSETSIETEDIGTNEITKDFTKMLVLSQASTEWTPLEKDLYSTGVEIFGKNSCLIAKNTLWIKTCLEVYNYMREQDQCTDNNETEENNEVEKEVSRRRPKLVRRKGKLRKHARYPLAIKKAAKEENKSHKQYTPCTCKSKCGDQCICLTNGNCCEKYCGCPKTCNNRFQGCNCAIGQCINRQCICFAANRECDPDLCRSCTLSCGEGSSSCETSEITRCKNMRLLLKKPNRILLGRSDVHGWGGFTRDSIKKNELIGEYTGELISQDEANERGIIDNELGFSYLFTLNEQQVIDARYKGNKFRFLNHSARPNCYAKLVIVGGDHRIGIFADRAIEEGEELLFDYCYGPGQAAWSASSNRKPRKSYGTKRIRGASKTTRNVGP